MSGNTAISYARVSTHEQSTAGISLDVQLQALRDFADHEELQLIQHFTDVGSATTLARRPGLSSALAHFEEGNVGCLLVTTLDRLTRSRKDFDGLVGRYFTLVKLLLLSSEGLTTATVWLHLCSLAVFRHA